MNFHLTFGISVLAQPTTPPFTKTIDASAVCSHWRVLLFSSISCLAKFLRVDIGTASPSRNCKMFAFLHLNSNDVQSTLISTRSSTHTNPFFLIKSQFCLLWRTCPIINNIISTFHSFTLHLTLSKEPLKTPRCATTPTHFKTIVGTQNCLHLF